MAAEEGWVDIAEVAVHLQVTKDSIYRWVYEKEFPAHRVGRLLRFRLSEVDEWVTTSGRDDSGSGSSRKPKESRSAGRKSSGKKSRHG